MTSKPREKRERRPPFDRERGVAVAQDLFHARGFDAVGVADLTKALEINPPSLYAAYGSKVELFERAMQRYAATTMLPLAEILADGRDPTIALTDLLRTSARHYTADKRLRGCMVTEGMRADDAVARTKAAEVAKPGSDFIRAYVRRHFPEVATELGDYVLMTMRGLSSFACLGYTPARLDRCACIAAGAFEHPVSSLGARK